MYCLSRAKQDACQGYQDRGMTSIIPYIKEQMIHLDICVHATLCFNKLASLMHAHIFSGVTNFSVACPFFHVYWVTYMYVAAGASDQMRG